MDYDIDIKTLFATYHALLPMAEVDKARLWKKFRLDWNYNSNRIEGNTLTYGETRALLEEGIEPHRIRKDILQMKSHDGAIDFLLDLVADKDTRLISETDIRALNEKSLNAKYKIETITPDGNITEKIIIPGRYKTMPNVVLRTDGSTHEYAPPHEVPMHMEAIIKKVRRYIKGKQDVALSDFLADLHQDFIQTHPFDDGNGRVVRLLMNFVTLSLGWPPLIIKSDKRAEYIDALERWNDGDKTHFRKLIKDELIWSLNKSIAAARGEPIDDPEDLDKEIDLFVRDKSHDFESQLEKRLRERELFRETIDTIVKSLEVKLSKFQPLFQTYTIQPALIVELPIFRNGKNKNDLMPLGRSLKLHGYLTDEIGSNFDIAVIGHISDAKATIFTSIRFEESSDVAQNRRLFGVESEKQKISFDYEAYLKVNSVALIENHSQTILNLVFEKIKTL